MRSQYSKSMCTHEHAELCEAREKVGALYHRWSPAAEDFILKASEAGNIRSCVGRGTMLRTRTVPILPHVAKHKSHVGAGEARIWAGLVSKILTIDGRMAWREKVALTIVFALRLRELARQVDPARAQQVFNWAWRTQHVATWVDRADEVLIEAQAEERIAEQRRRTHATKTYSQSLESAWRKRARAAHRWATQTIPSAQPMDYQNSTTPQQSMQTRTEEWGGRWNRAKEARDILMRQTQSLRQQALSTTPRNWTAKSVRHGLSSMKGNRARGDRWLDSE